MYSKVHCPCLLGMHRHDSGMTMFVVNRELMHSSETSCSVQPLAGMT